LYLKTRVAHTFYPQVVFIDPSPTRFCEFLYVFEIGESDGFYGHSYIKGNREVHSRRVFYYRPEYFKQGRMEKIDIKRGTLVLLDEFFPHGDEEQNWV